VFAFLIDPNAPWTAVKEQDRLVSEPEKAAEIIKAVQKLQEFKAYLGRERMRQTFTGPDDLAMNVAIALANIAPPRTDGAVSTTRVWQPLFCHFADPRTGQAAPPRPVNPRFFPVPRLPFRGMIDDRCWAIRPERGQIHAKPD
jgi:hypothetical protein